jgi:amino acid adenylation domain-containing protein/thioester reductase-like protein
MTIDLRAAAACIHERLDATAQQRPDTIAVVDGETTMTFAELSRRARVLARRMRAAGVTRGALVAIHLERSCDSVAGLWAASLAGAVYLPIDIDYAPGRVAAILERARPALVLSRAALADRLPSGARVLLVAPGDCLPADAEAEVPSPAMPDDAAYALYTSGSTGVPKGVVVEHRSLVNYVDAAAEAYGFVAGDRVLHGASLGFDLSIEEILVTLCAGGTLVLRSAAMLDSVSAFLDECRQRALTVVSITSVLWHELTARLADGTAELPGTLRLVILGADAARADVLADWQRASRGRVRLINSYGLTETTVVATIWEAGREPIDPSLRSLPIGKPLRNVSVYVLDERQRQVVPGAVGEVCIGGLAVARGYLGDEALTAARFVADPFLPGGRMYRTGDRGRLLASGDLEFLGRDDHQVKIRGHRVELGEIEARLRQQPGIREAVVVRIPERDDELVAFATHDGRPFDLGQLRAALAQSLASYMLPARIELLDAFRLTSAGKIDRRVLAELATRGRQRRDSFIPPETSLQQQVATVVAESLHLAQVGLDDDFTALGCTSLAALRAASVLGARFGLPVGARLLYEASTVRALAATLGRMAQGDAAPHDEARELDLLASDARLDATIEAPAASSPPTAPATVLLTGATGFFGSFLLASLLEQTDAHVHCLVRAATPDQAAKRLRAALAARHCDIDPRLLAERVTAVPGDLEQPWLGVRDPLRTRLLQTVDAIYHAGATVSYVLPYRSLREANSLAVERVLRFAVTGRPKRVHHVSTIGVVPAPEASGALPDERFVADDASQLPDGYARSKWVAERLVSEARLRGVEVTIHRPGRLMGHSLTGAFNPADFLVQLLATCAAIGAAPELDAAVDVTPVDFASDALVELSLSRPAEPRVFHLLSPHPVAWQSLVAGVAERGWPMPLMPFEVWRARCLAGAARAAQLQGGGDFSIYLAGLSQREVADLLTAGASSQRTARCLRRKCPRVDDALLDAYVRELARCGLLPARLRSDVREAC